MITNTGAPLKNEIPTKIISTQTIADECSSEPSANAAPIAANAIARSTHACGSLPTRQAKRTDITANAKGMIASLHVTGSDQATVRPLPESASTTFHDAYASSAPTAAEVTRLKSDATRSGHPLGIASTEDSARCLPVPAASSAPRKPTHSVRC